MEKIGFNEMWFFTPRFDDDLLSPKIKNASLQQSLQKVRLPHSVCQTPVNYFPSDVYEMQSGYRREFKTEKSWKNKRVFINFMAAAHEAKVFLNGALLGTHSCGYTSFRFELTKFLLEEGETNVLAVSLDSRETLDIPPFGFVIDYMTFGGLYREVFLEIENENFISDIFVSTKKSTVRANVRLDKKTSATLFCSVLDCSRENKIFSTSREIVDLDEARFEFDAGEIKFWSCETPELYYLKVELRYGAVTIDEKTVRFGFRDIEMNADGLFLNGKKILLRGMNRHQSFANVGYAMCKSLQRYDADILKDELCVNAVRTSHYPQSRDFIDRCDERGLLVFTEIPGWQHIGKSEKWREQCVKNVEEMVAQYKNHPSIFLWGVRVNESPDDDALYNKTNSLCRALDPTRPTGGVRCIKKSRLLEDIYTYNDFIYDGTNIGCTPKSQVTPDANAPYIVTEYAGHMFPTKIFDDEIHRTEHALRHAAVIDAIAAEKGVAGSFAWCAFDYNTHKDFGSGDGICYHGVMDIYRNPKTAAAVYKIQQDDIPVLEISSSMNVGEHPASARGKNWIFTNADSVKMYLGEKFIAEFSGKASPYKNLLHAPILIDDYVGHRLVDEEGFSEAVSKDLKNILNCIALNGQNAAGFSQIISFLRLMAKGFNRQKITDLYTKYVGNWGERADTFRFDAVIGGKVVKSVSKGEVRSLDLVADISSTTLHEEGSWDAASVRLSVRDQFGNVLSYFNEPVEFTASGAIEIIGERLNSFRGGVCALYVKTIGKIGKASLEIRSGALRKEIAFLVE